MRSDSLHDHPDRRNLYIRCRGQFYLSTWTSYLLLVSYMGYVVPTSTAFVQFSCRICDVHHSPVTRCYWSRSSLLPRSDIWELIMVLPRGSGGCSNHLSTRSPVESCKLPVMAGGFRRNEPCASRYRCELFFVVGNQCHIQWLNTSSKACMVVQVQYISLHRSSNSFRRSN